MRIVNSISQIKRKGAVLSIGNFDGVHAGHREILAEAKKAAKQRSAELIVMTFEPHPVMVLQPDQKHGLLTPIELKKCLLQSCGVDCLVVLPCDAGLLSLSAFDFIQRFIAEPVEPSVVVEGEDFNFGCGRTGNVELLRRFAAGAGFELIVVQPKIISLSKKQIRSSSTLIRHLLQSGYVADAAGALVRPYRLYGQVVAGRGRGKKLGFPTANIAPAEQIIPAEGVYAGRAATAGSEKQICRAEAKQPAALSIGRCRTYGEENPLLVEAHILEGKISRLQGKFLAVDFVKRIRDQQKFKTEKDLAAQIAKDCKKAREILTADFT